MDMRDIGGIARKFGTSGTPITKASLEYDSDWMDITNKPGQYFNITHNQNSTDIIVDIQGKTTSDGGVHQRYLGLELDSGSGWWGTYGGSNNDWAFSVTPTEDGGYVMTGHTESFGNGARDVWLVKTDWTGDMQWNRTFGRSGNDEGRCVIQTSDGGYAIAGYTPIHPQGFGDNDVWLIKTDHNGYEQWNKTYGGALSDIGMSVLQTDDGGYVIGGYEASFAGTDSDDFYLIKTDQTGNMIWNKTYGGGEPETSYSMIKTNDGGYALAGVTWSFGAGVSDVWLVKTDSTGNMQWNKTYGGSGSDEGWEVIQTADGGYAVAGMTDSYGAGIGDFWLLKTDSTGNLVWSQTYGGSGQDEARSIVQTIDGGYVLAGNTRSNPTDILDAWLIKVNNAGNIQWNKTYGGAGEDAAWSLIETDNEGWAAAGFTASTGQGAKDFWLVKINTESGLAWTDSTADTITLYRGATDLYWNYVRVKVWTIKEN
jgi:hypothetical protein